MKRNFLKSLNRFFQIDPRVPFFYRFILLMETLLGLIRGFLYIRKPIIIGPHVRIKSTNYLECAGYLTRIGANCYLDCLSENGIKIGTNFKLGSFSRLEASGTLNDLGKGIIIGNNVGISNFAHIGGAGGFEIGNDTIVGAFFSAHPENHKFGKSDQAIKDQGIIRKGIKIGSGCWVGAKVTILDGVEIGKNSVIAAGAVVNKSFPENVLLAGVPAKIIRKIS